MGAGLLFWILMLLWLVLWGIYRRPADPAGWGIVVPDFIAFVLFLILGWHAFGAPVKF